MNISSNLFGEIFLFLEIDLLKNIVKYSKKYQNMMNIPKYLYFFSNFINHQIIDLCKNTYINESINNYFTYFLGKINNKIDKITFYKFIQQYSKYHSINIKFNNNFTDIIQYIKNNLNIKIEKIPKKINYFNDIEVIKIHFNKNFNFIEENDIQLFKKFMNKINPKVLEEIIIENNNNSFILDYLLEKETLKLSKLQFLTLDDSIEIHEKVQNIIQKNKNNLISLQYVTIDKLNNQFEKICKNLNKIQEINIGKLDYFLNCFSKLLIQISNLSFNNPDYYIKENINKSNIQYSNFININNQNKKKVEKKLNPFLNIKNPPNSLINLKIITFSFTENTNYIYYLKLIEQNRYLEEINVSISKYLPIKIKEKFFNIINNLPKLKTFSILDGKLIKYLKNKALKKINIDKIENYNLNLLFENCLNINSIILTRSNIININKNINNIYELVIYNKEIKINLESLIWVFSQYKLKKLEINIFEFDEDIENEVFDILKKFIKEFELFINLNTCILVINDFGNDIKKEMIKYLNEEFSKFPWKNLKVINQMNNK